MDLPGHNEGTTLTLTLDLTLTRTPPTCEVAEPACGLIEFYRWSNAMYGKLGPEAYQALTLTLTLVTAKDFWDTKQGFARVCVCVCVWECQSRCTAQEQCHHHPHHPGGMSSLP